MPPTDINVTFCKLEFLGPDGWEVGHHGVNLIHPERYPERLAANGKVGRVIIVDTGEIISGPLEPDPCSVCGNQHTGIEGSCIL